MVAVRLPSQLRKYADDTEYVTGIGTTVIEVLRSAVDTHPDLRIRLFDNAGAVHAHLAVFHQDELVERNEYGTRPLAKDDRLEVLIGITGGADA